MSLEGYILAGSPQAAPLISPSWVVTSASTPDADLGWSHFHLCQARALNQMIAVEISLISFFSEIWVENEV